MCFVEPGRRVICYHAAHGYDLVALRQVRFPAGAVNHMLPLGLRVSQVERYDEWDATNLDAETNRILAEHGHLHELRRSLITSIVVAGEFYGTLVLDNLYSHTEVEHAIFHLCGLCDLCGDSKSRLTMRLTR